MIIAGLGGRSLLVYHHGKGVVLGDEPLVKPPIDYDEDIVLFGENFIELRGCKGFHRIIIKDDHIYVDEHIIPLSLLEDKPYPQLLIAGTDGFLWSCKLGSNLHILHVDDVWLNYVLSGRKVVEGRLYDDKRREISVGDCIILRNNDDSRECYVYVKYMHIYPSFKDMLLSEGVNRVLPSISDVDEGVNVYYKYYSREDEERYGVVAIGLGLL